MPQLSDGLLLLAILNYVQTRKDLHDNYTVIILAPVDSLFRSFFFYVLLVVRCPHIKFLENELELNVDWPSLQLYNQQFSRVLKGI